MKDHPDETTLMRDNPDETMLVRNHPDESHPEERPPGERPPWWETTLVKDHPDERPPWWETTLMKDHPEERAPWWETTLKKDHRHRAPVSAQGGIIHLVVKRRVREARPTQGKCLPVSGPACCCAARPASGSPWWLPWCPCAPGGCASPCSTLAATHSNTATCGDECQPTASFWSNVQQCALRKAIPTKLQFYGKTQDHCFCSFSISLLAEESMGYAVLGSPFPTPFALLAINIQLYGIFCFKESSSHHGPYKWQNAWKLPVLQSSLSQRQQEIWMHQTHGPPPLFFFLNNLFIKPLAPKQ